MSATKWTPGPWFVGVQNDWPYVIDRAPSASGMDCTNDQCTNIVASIRAENGGEALANAHLIAASPRLYAALEALAACHAEQVDELDPEIIEARAALAAARGEA